MAKKKKIAPTVEEKPAEIIYQEISEVLETNYMPYAMSVIVSRSIPEIAGFKPSHRKLLYTMYKMGLLGGNRTKSANTHHIIAIATGITRGPIQGSCLP